MSLPTSIPPRPDYTVTTEVHDYNQPGAWNGLDVTVVDADGLPVATYERPYPSLMQTFEPFNQWDGERWWPMAVISDRYTRSAVIDLTSGELLAAEEPTKFGFCPVEFYAPTFCDAFCSPDDHSLCTPEALKEWADDYPLSHYCGTWALVAGCIWGDDSSWKVEYLDLSRVREGVLTRSQPFGYHELPDNLSLREAATFQEGLIYLAARKWFRWSGVLTAKKADDSP